MEPEQEKSEDRNPRPEHQPNVLPPTEIVRNRGDESEAEVEVKVEAEVEVKVEVKI